MRIVRIQWTSAQFKNLNSRFIADLDPMLCVLARWTFSIRIQQDSAWKAIGGIIIEMLVSVLQTHYDDCKSLKSLSLCHNLSFDLLIIVK